MSNPDVEVKLRVEVFDLIERCTDEKLIRGGAQRAEVLAEEARSKAERLPRLRLLYRLASYRLAHLLLRRNDANAKLPQIDRHFRIASGIDDATEVARAALGPLPAIYRLAGLHRMQLSGRDRPDDAEVEAAHTYATERVRHQARKSELEPIQTGFHNLLELALMFAGHPLHELEGRGMDPLPAHSSTAWVLLSSAGGVSAPLLGREFAEAELEAWSEQQPVALVLRLTPDVNGEPNPTLRNPITGQSVTLSADQGRLLALYLRDRVVTNETVEGVVPRAEGEDPNAARRKIKSRLKVLIRQLSPDDHVVFALPGREGDRLSGRTRFLGIAPLRELAPRDHVTRVSQPRR